MSSTPSETPQSQHEKAAVLLANAGLAPFLFLTLLSFLHIAPELSLRIMTFYSLAILCFLSGTWWGFALVMPNADTGTRTLNLVVSNVVVLLAVGAVAFLPAITSIFVLALLYPLGAFLERRLPGLNRQPAYYRNMRLRVSMIAAGSHLLFGWAISAV